MAEDCCRGKCYDVAWQKGHNKFDSVSQSLIAGGLISLPYARTSLREPISYLRYAMGLKPDPPCGTGFKLVVTLILPKFWCKTRMHSSLTFFVFPDDDSDDSDVLGRRTRSWAE